MFLKNLLADMSIQIGAVIFGAATLVGAIALYAYLAPN
jgi:hypothetical protein